MVASETASDRSRWIGGELMGFFWRNRVVFDECGLNDTGHLGPQANFIFFGQQWMPDDSRSNFILLVVTQAADKRGGEIGMLSESAWNIPIIMIDQEGETLLWSVRIVKECVSDFNSNRPFGKAVWLGWWVFRKSPVPNGFGNIGIGSMPFLFQETSKKWRIG